jgi:Flp pilus assembly protein TadG
VKTFTRPGEDQGSAAVEFALVLPVLLLILFGIIDFGRMLNARIVLTQAAHEGARTAAVTGDPDAAAATIAKVMGSMASGMGTPTIVGCDDPLGDATVTVTYQFDFATPLSLVGGFGDEDGMTLTSTAVVPCL